MFVGEIKQHFRAGDRQSGDLRLMILFAEAVEGAFDEWGDFVPDEDARSVDDDADEEVADDDGCGGQCE